MAAIDIVKSASGWFGTEYIRYIAQAAPGIIGCRKFSPDFGPMK
jgi:hypothetical protein